MKSSKKSNKPRTNKKVESVLPTVTQRADFARIGVPTAYKVAMFSIASTCLASIALIVSFIFEPAPKYFAGTDDGRFVKLIPLSKPFHSDSVVQDWVNKCIVESFSFNFSDMRRQLNKSMSACYTKQGAQALQSELEKSGILKAVQERKLFLESSLNHTPVIAKKVAGRAHAWMVQADGFLTYRTSSNDFTQNVLFTVEVRRQSMRLNPLGLGIHKVIVSKKQ